MKLTKPYVLLRPVDEPHVPDVDMSRIVRDVTPDHLRTLLASVKKSDALVVDIETRGTDPLLPDSAIYGVGLAWRRGDGPVRYIYVVYQTLSDTARYTLWQCVSEARGVVLAHNLMFEMAWIRREIQELNRRRPGDTGTPEASVREPRWTHCTYGLYRQLATEGFPKQSWSLKTAQVELLGWPENNAGPVEEWLVSRGYHKVGPKLLEHETAAEHLDRIEEWVAVNPEKREGKVKADKANLWRVPPSLLGKYCILDCLSTLQLFELVLWPALEQFPEIDVWHREYFGGADGIDSLLVDQQAHGILLDLPKLKLHGERLRRVMETARTDLWESSLGSAIAAIEQAHVVAHLAKEPARYKKRKDTKEPVKFKKKTGELTTSWKAWWEKKHRPDQETKPWRAWLETLERLRAGEVENKKFNFSSDKQLRRVIYKSYDPDDGFLGQLEWRATDRTAFKKGKDIPVFEINGRNGWVDLQGTDAGELPVNGDLYSQLPDELRDPLQAHADAEQELGFVDAYLEQAVAYGDGRIHPGWKSPGTKTLRLAGSKPNLQQVPKTVQLLECMVADPGTVWLEMDWSALEPHVLAELSRDPALLELYGPGAPAHDVYMFAGTGYAVFGEEVRKHYDRRKPDVKKAKAALKKLRDGVLKTTVLSKQYRAGWRSIQMKSRLQGYSLTDEQAKQISDSHDKMFAVSGKQFHEILEKEWHMRGGWVLTGLGHPNPVWEGALKDLINRVVQRTGHDIHTMFVVDLARAMRRARIPAVGVVEDFHDQLIRQVPEEYGQVSLEICQRMVARMNEMLGAEVKLKGEPKLCTNMAQAKEAEFNWEGVRGYSDAT